MFKLNKNTNTIEEVKEAEFKDLGFFERNDIQEWIISNPRILEEDLLIITKEFADFDGTQERFDLLALDKEGNLVVIENKRDDSGKSVDWQAVKYASYCSTLLKQEIIDIHQRYLDKYKSSDDKKIDAEDNINKFFEYDDSITYPTDTQRIILVSHKFRKEVLSAAQWLLNQGIDIKCVTITPYPHGNDLLLDHNVILPQQENKEYTLKLAERTAETKASRRSSNRNAMLHKEFWGLFVEKFINKDKTSFKDREFYGNTDSYISGSASMGGPRTSYQLYTNNKGSRIQLVIDSAKGPALNTAMFDYLLQYKEEIEKALLGYEVVWLNDDSNASCRIYISEKDLTFNNKDNWDDIFNFFITNIERFEGAFKHYAKHIREMYINYSNVSDVE